MTANQYHDILITLSQAEHQFEENSTNWALGDRELYRALRRIRSEILKRESGHPFSKFSFIEPGSGFDVMFADNCEQSVGELACPAVRLLVVDDDDAVRAVIRELISNCSEMRLVGEARNGREGIELAILEKPDVIVMDFDMPVLNGLEAARCILRVKPESKIILLTGSREVVYAEHAAKIGLAGLLYKPARGDELVAAIQQAYLGRRGIGVLDE